MYVFPISCLHKCEFYCNCIRKHVCVCICVYIRLSIYSFSSYILYFYYSSYNMEKSYHFSFTRSLARDRVGKNRNQEMWKWKLFKLLNTINRTMEFNWANKACSYLIHVQLQTLPKHTHTHTNVLETYIIFCYSNENFVRMAFYCLIV